MLINRDTMVFRLLQPKHHHGERGKMGLQRTMTAVNPMPVHHHLTAIGIPASPEFTVVRIQDHVRLDAFRNSDPVIVSRNGSCIHNHEKIFGAASGGSPPYEGPHSIGGVMEINPFESLGSVVQKR